MNEKPGEITRVQELIYELKIEQVMTRNVITVAPDCSIGNLKRAAAHQTHLGRARCARRHAGGDDQHRERHLGAGEGWKLAAPCSAK